MSGKPVLALSDLAQFTGTEQWFRHGLNRKCLYTEGVRFVAESAGAYWLIDVIASAQFIGRVREETFQVWHLVVNGAGGIVTCDDGGKDGARPFVVYSQDLDFTDFPLPEIKFYCCDGVVMLPTEY